MNFREFFTGIGDFKPADEIIRLISRYNQLRERPVDSANAEALLIFQTSEQQTWLVVAKNGIYCVLDDLNNSFTRVQWFMPKRELIERGEIITDVTTGDKSENTGLLNIGARRNWLFSKRLFTDETIENLIKSLILRKMAD